MSITAYCVKCREKKRIKEPEPIFMANGRPATRGTCPDCGTGLFRIGETRAHQGMTPPDPPARDDKLVIVESPAKARTVGRFLGQEYTVKASVGHVRDLLKSRLSVDVHNDFAPEYRVPKEKREVVKELQTAVKGAGQVYLATDPDREGEAIAWHLMEAARIPQSVARRVVFHEITEGAIDEAFSHPRGIDMKLVNAQQARRILDRLVGYKISPLLWDRVRSRLSAGRVQSVALRLIVEREREIEAFLPVEYWSIEAELAKQELKPKKRRESFRARLHRINDKEVDLKNEADTQSIVDELEKAAYIVTSVQKRERRRRPAAPYTTSTLQQEASRRLGFTAKRTMAVAQQLYEGVALGGEGSVGLITYMRTDSVNVAAQAQAEARSLIAEKFGPDFLPPRPPVYKTKAKSAQEAHEAIRPTSVRREPEAIKKYLTRDQQRLYDLIWKRFVASQMVPAIMDTTSVDIKAGLLPVGTPLSADNVKSVTAQMPYLFRATGSVIKFAGFLVVYEEARDEDTVQENGEGVVLPPLSVDELLDLLKLYPEQHFTQPPPRYSEASLVKALEEYGIGRPSTYAPIISTIQTRGYVEREDKRLVPTELGFVVNDLVVQHFPEVVDVGFTARMEEDLDLIASGRRDWVPVLREFWVPFEETLRKAEKTMRRVEIPAEETGERCEKCGHPMIVKFGRYGKFIACSNFPACRNTRSYQIKTGVNCPECGGDLVEKRTRRGRTFFGCANYPACEFSVWNRPVPEPCPACGGLLTEKGKRGLACVKCGNVVERAEGEEGDEGA